MIHTLLLKKRINKECYDKLRDVLYKYCDKTAKIYWIKMNKKLRCDLFADEGMIIFLTIYKVGKYYHTYIEMKINPKRMLGNRDLVNLSMHEDLLQFSDVFSKLLFEVNGCLSRKLKKYMDVNLIDAYSLNRIDFAVNIETKYSKQIIELMQRSEVPKGFELLYVSESKRRKHRKGSFYCKSNYATLNFYDKSMQLENLSKYNLGDVPENILRFEVQCKYNKVRSVLRNFGISKEQIKILFRKDIISQINLAKIAFNVILYYCGMVIGEGDYYCMEEAEKIIDRSKHKKNIIIELKEVLYLICKHKYVSNARRKFGDDKRFYKSIKRLNKLGINAITIPKEYNVDFIENPIYKIKKSFFPEYRRIKVKHF